MHDDAWNNLLNHLDREITLLQQFQSILEAEQQALSNNNAEAIQEIQTDKNQIVEAIQHTVTNRINTQEQLLKPETGHSDNQHIFDALLNETPKSDHNRIKNQQKNWLALAQRCQELNETNSLVMQVNMHSLQRLVSLLKGQGTNAPLYDAKGKVQQQTGSQHNIQA